MHIMSEELYEHVRKERIMAYKVGDKFVIEIDSVMTNKKGNLYGVKGFKTLVFDEYGLEQLERIPGEFEYHVGEEVTDLRAGHSKNGVITEAARCFVSVLWKDGSVEEFYRTNDDIPYKGFRRTGFVDHRIIEWVSDNDRN